MWHDMFPAAFHATVFPPWHAVAVQFGAAHVNWYSAGPVPFGASVHVVLFAWFARFVTVAPSVVTV
jgi:hypothetical protein